MDENMNVVGQELVQAAEEKLMDAGQTLEKAVAVTTQATVPAISQPTKTFTIKNVAIGGTGLLVGGAIGYAVNKWVIPWFSEEARDERKARKEEKKAEKKAKKEAAKTKKGKKPAAKKAEKEPKKPESEQTDDDGIDPNEIETDED